jgi:hypothetical protein
VTSIGFGASGRTSTVVEGEATGETGPADAASTGSAAESVRVATYPPTPAAVRHATLASPTIRVLVVITGIS